MNSFLILPTGHHIHKSRVMGLHPYPENKSVGVAEVWCLLADFKRQMAEPWGAEPAPVVDRRFELSKAALTGLLASEPADVILPTEHTCRRAVAFADALLAELDRKGEV